MRHTQEVIAALSSRGLLALVSVVCARRGVTFDELCAAARTRSVSYARHEVWWNIRYFPQRHYSYIEIARLFGCDHSSVRYGVIAHARRGNPHDS
jgi:chromosomal replication initiation ATPase DnaA